MFALVAALMLAPSAADADIKVTLALMSADGCKCKNPDCSCEVCKGDSCKCLISKTKKQYEVVAMKLTSGATVFVVSNKAYPTSTDSKHYRNRYIAQLEANRLNGKELKRDAPLILAAPKMMAPQPRMMAPRTSGNC